MTRTRAFSRLLVATDFSAQSERAWDVARRLAEDLGAELVLAHVLVWEDSLRSLEPAERLAAERSRHAAGELNIPHETVGDITRTTEQWVDDKLAEWAGPPRAAGLKVRTLVRSGAPHRELVAAAREEGADLIVMSTRGRGSLERLLVGSVADRVVRMAPCPVLLCA
jgi:nucleotide-binding universal stress UspA family protein